jgi:hypothetical protein
MCLGTIGVQACMPIRFGVQARTPICAWLAFINPLSERMAKYCDQEVFPLKVLTVVSFMLRKVSL